MMSGEQLPDLAVTPPTKAEEMTNQFKDGELDDILTAAVGEAGVSEERAEEIIARAGEFEKMLEEGQKKPVKASPPELPEETAREKAKRRADERIKEKTPVKLGKGGKKISQARLALALQAPAATQGVVKPGPALKKGEMGAKEEGTPKKEEEGQPAREENPLSPGKEEAEEEGAKTPTQASSSASGGKGKKHAHAPALLASPPERLDDDGLWVEDPEGDFPAVPPSVGLDQYENLSVHSVHIEGLAEDISAVSRQVSDLVAMVTRMTGQVARLEERVVNIEKDRTQFASSLLDRVRQNERALGNRPPTSTPSASLSVAPASSASAPPARHKLTPEEKRKMMAALMSPRPE